MGPDLAADLAEHWNGCRRPGTPAVTAEDCWPLLRILADAGLVTGEEEPLTTLQLGPFRLAQTPYQRATRDFLDILLPSLVVGCADGIPAHGAITGILAGGTRGFVELLRHGVVFGRSPVDRLRWDLLIHVKQRNGEGRYPTLSEVIAEFTGQEPQDGRSVGDVREAVEWLLNTKVTDNRSQPSLLRFDTDCGLESLV